MIPMVVKGGLRLGQKNRWEKEADLLAELQRPGFNNMSEFASTLEGTQSDEVVGHGMKAST